nr:retrovirus-related Pol polyprotein from transposon TNT 1-94 [Tanacetum cinerariifolium]
MTTLADKAILSGANNHPPMLEKDMYDSWKSIMEIYMMNRQHGRMILESVKNGPLIWSSIEEIRVTRPKKYSELSATEAIQADCDVKETNIILQGLSPEETEYKLYDEFDMFAYKKGGHYTDMMKLVVEIKCFGMSADEFDKETGSSDGLQPKQADLSCICLGVDLEPNEWIKDSGCSKHMASNQKLFSSYKAYNRGNVIFGSNLRGNIIGKGQICDKECKVTFSKHDSEITKDGKVIGRGIRKKGLYVMKLRNKPKDKIYLATIDENSTLWHRRLGHANMRLVQSLASKKLVRNLPKLKFDQHFCDACKIKKQAHASHRAKNIVSMTRCLELLHMDLFGPFAVQNYRGNRYTLVIVDDYSRYT